MTRVNTIATASGLTVGLLCVPISVGALDPDRGLILQGLDTFARDHISHLCSVLVRRGSYQPVYMVYSEPKSVTVAPPPTAAEPIDRSNETAKQLAERYFDILSDDANRISSARFRFCHAGAASAALPPSTEVILVSRTDTQAFGVFYHRLGDVPDTDVIALSTDMSLAARSLAQAWNIHMSEEQTQASSAWQPWLRGAVPGGLIALGSTIPFLIADSHTKELEDDCRSRPLECNQASREDDVRTLDAWHQGLLYAGLGLAGVGAALCGALDVCLWPQSLWFGGVAKDPEPSSATLSVSLGLTAISVKGTY